MNSTPSDKDDKDKTIAESGRTVAESDKTIAEKKSGSSLEFKISSFRDYPVLRQYPASGGEADIYLLEKESDKRILKLYRYGMNPKKDILRQVKELSDTFPEHIVRIYEYGYDDRTGRWYEIQEYAEYGSLRDFVKTRPDESQLRRIIDETVEGLKVLHYSNILHLDIKPSNILVRETSPLDLIFTDFGIASVLDPELSKKLTNVKGTPLYWSPEAFTGVVGREADYWSLGMIVLELFVNGK